MSTAAITAAAPLKPAWQPLTAIERRVLGGAQTVGELRGHAARMEPIADLAALQPLLEGLMAKGLVIALTPEGRGQVVAHTLYQPSELERLRAEHGGRGADDASATSRVD